MGLGLSISATIVSAHGGRIWAEPSKLGGIAFHFTIVDADIARRRANNAGGALWNSRVKTRSNA